ncbi:tRNA adenosine(34) deaminase TadA [Dellaglioa algida]|uniref:tRNA adenosine(34) deaminase TadA n=1 Tax=Dellaglioa algida TaxID=105612 RepID=UPI000BDCEE94|nr:tRNA adenosine(34) deaminase TadA [Dellaglioa algida]MDK1718739.1 tRNA adenosine(34) deaminase TadA [Dellaglioa algida]MDK1730312.1 tRNA adenosine(34) deaminase TadA [Dellaglioa algida]MDK1742746.1 tRNA adenosine(34) deaminase TadA [Dellaglioa algida]SOB51305.1 tRNA specific adenosine deaminase [Dellaglioa algida]
MPEKLTEEQKEFFMREALYEARNAKIIGEVPIGCVVVQNGEIIGRGHNIREHIQDATLHAEILAIQEACAAVHSWRLVDAQLFVTLEPCPMCSGAIINSRIPEVYFGAFDPKAGTVGSIGNLLTDERFNHQAKVESGLLLDEAKDLLQSFFREVRRKRKEKKRSQG